MDLISPLFPSAFVFVVCLGSLSRSFSKFYTPYWCVCVCVTWNLVVCRKTIQKKTYFSSDFGFIYLAGVASGATRAALTQHFALQNNAADISAKVLAQYFDPWMWPLNHWMKLLVLTIKFHFTLKGRKSRDIGNNVWHGVGYASCSHHYGKSICYLVFVFGSHHVPYVW